MRFSSGIYFIEKAGDLFLRFSRIFEGRNGPDGLSMATSILACILLILNMFLGGVASNILWCLALILLLLSYFRMFSRNLPKRQLENARFLKLVDPIRGQIALRRTKKAQKNLYCFFKCPACGTVLRVPKGKGRIRITCKNCSHIFERNS